MLSAIFDTVDRDSINVTFPEKRGISHANWDKYIEDASFESRSLLLKIKKETLYVTWDMFISYLEDSFAKFVSRIGDQPFLIHLPCDKFGSEYVFVAWLWKHIKKLNFQGIISSDDHTLLKKDSNVLFIDDAVYSGANIIGSIDELNYITNLSFNCYIVVACSSSSIFDVMIPGIITELCTGLILPPISTEGTKYAQFMDELTPLYFDHKIAGDGSTFNYVYLDLVSIVPDTLIKNRLYEQYFKDVVQPPADTNHCISMDFEKLRVDRKTIDSQLNFIS